MFVKTSITPDTQIPLEHAAASTPRVVAMLSKLPSLTGTILVTSPWKGSTPMDEKDRQGPLCMG
jgi:hypothetical protein